LALNQDLEWATLFGTAVVFTSDNINFNEVQSNALNSGHVASFMFGNAVGVTGGKVQTRCVFSLSARRV